MELMDTWCIYALACIIVGFANKEVLLSMCRLRSCNILYDTLFIHPATSRRLDKAKFYGVGAGLFTGITVALYPVSVVKTRMQVAVKDSAEKNALSVIKGLLKNDGVPGLYRGFGTVITGAIPARIIFLTALETTKVGAYKLVEPFKFSEPTQAAMANGLAGMTASLFSQAVFVPIDVVCRLGLVF